jgi:hypothetical protein
VLIRFVQDEFRVEVAAESHRMQEPAYRILVSSLAATIRQPAGLLIEKTEIAPRPPSI